MRSLSAVAAALLTMLVTATSSAQSSPDIFVDVDPESIVDLDVSGVGSRELGVTDGSLSLRTDDPFCTTSECQMDLIHLVVTLEGFDLELEVTAGSSTVGTAEITVVNPTVAILGPLTIENEGSGFVVPIGTQVSLTATVSGTIDLIGSSPVVIPTELRGNIVELTAPLVIDVSTSPTQALALTGEFSFELDEEYRVDNQNVTIGVSGSASILGSGLTPFQACSVLRGDLSDVEDQMIDNSLPNYNHGSSTYMISGAETAGETLGTVKQSLIWFDLSSIPEETPISSATLLLREAFSSAPRTVEVHRITAAWSEGTVTYNSFNEAFDAAVEATVTSAPSTHLHHLDVADVKALVQEWVDGLEPNYGMLLEQAPVDGEATTFRTSESTNIGDKPQLTVCYQLDL